MAESGLGSVITDPVLGFTTGVGTLGTTLAASFSKRPLPILLGGTAAVPAYFLAKSLSKRHYDKERRATQRATAAGYAGVGIGAATAMYTSPMNRLARILHKPVQRWSLKELKFASKWADKISSGAYKHPRGRYVARAAAGAFGLGIPALFLTRYLSRKYDTAK